MEENIFIESSLDTFETTPKTTKKTKVVMQPPMEGEK